MSRFVRTIAMIEENNYNILKNSNILICGLGGVGGMAFLSLVRMGITNFTLVDFDKFDISNLNRQMLSNTENINLLKVDEAKRQALLINPEVNINVLNIKISEENINLLKNKYDYIVDCIDDVNAKVLLYKLANKNNIKLISSMGTAMKFDPTLLKVTKLNQTEYDPLAKKIRFLCKDNKELLKTKVVYSTELVLPKIKEKREKLGFLPSNVLVPNAAGLLLAKEVIFDLINSDILN